VSSGKALDLAVVLVLSGLGYVFGGPTFGWILIGVGVGFLAWSWQVRQPAPRVSLDLIVTPPGVWDVPSSSAMIQAVRDVFQQSRERRGG
jgi:hypothetical protein